MNVLNVGIVGNGIYRFNLVHSFTWSSRFYISFYLDRKMTTKILNNPNPYIVALKKDNAELTKQNYDLMKKYTVKTSDPVTNDVIDRIFVRHQQGMEKFKITMADNKKTIPEWIEESIEEKIDDICYMSTLKDRIIARENELLKENDRLRDDNQIAWLHNSKLDERIEKLKKELLNGQKRNIRS